MPTDLSAPRTIGLRRAAKPLACLLAVGLAVVGLAGCRTSPAVAAYVGDTQISTAQLADAVDERRSDADVATYADSLPDGAFTRQVLSLLIGEQVYEAVQQRYDVEVADAAVSARLSQIAQGMPEDQLFGQLAAQYGLTPDEAREIVAQSLVREQLAEDQGLTGPAGAPIAPADLTAATKPLVDQVEGSLDISVNPRYGSYQDGSVATVDDGVVQVLSGSGPSGTAAAGD